MHDELPSWFDQLEMKPRIRFIRASSAHVPGRYTISNSGMRVPTNLEQDHSLRLSISTLPINQHSCGLSTSWYHIFSMRQWPAS